MRISQNHWQLKRSKETDVKTGAYLTHYATKKKGVPTGEAGLPAYTQ